MSSPQVTAFAQNPLDMTARQAHGAKADLAADFLT
jgi:hypothetical protein